MSPARIPLDLPVENNVQPEEPLLQTCPDCGTVMDVSDVEPLSAVVCPNCGAPSVIASTIDHFELQEVLGHGGMGAVYKAHDTSLDRPVALKLLRKSSGSPEQIRQLATEAAITASINHPHVVRVFSTGTDRGRFYIAMELVEKGTLDRLIELQGRVAEAQVLEVGIQIASGLRAAHHAGLIHRDVKPGNILFADAHTAKIVDFGLAIFAEDEAKTRGEIWGTPYYVAPEKLDQKPEDFRSDIYSLGGTLFHALAGRPPFEAENASMVALKHLKSQAVSLQAFAPHVSSNTAYVINRTLNKDPAQRYQSYDELIQHLEYALTELQAGRGKAGSARVVIETAEDKKTMGWVVMALMGIILLLGLTAFFMRGRLFPKDTAAEGAASNGAVMFPYAFEKLADGRPGEAAAAMGKVVAQKPAQPRLNWAGLFEGLSLLLAERRDDANAAFSKVENRGLYSKKDADRDLARFFVEVGRRMQGDAPIDPDDVKVSNAASYQAVAPFFYGLKNWQVGRFEDGVKLLRQFRQSSPAGKDAWIADLKPIAGDYLDQYTAYEMAVDRTKAAKTLEQKKAALISLRAVKAPLATKVRDLTNKAANEVSVLEKERTALWAAGKVPDGRYRLISRRNGKALNVADRSKADGGKLTQNPYGGQPNQQWNITALGGFYLLVGVESGKAVGVPKGQTEEGVALLQGNVNKGPTQKWRIERIEPNIYKLTAEVSGKALTVGGDADGSAVIQKTYTGAHGQQWKIEAP
jgi:hypothetical protein